MLLIDNSADRLELTHSSTNIKPFFFTAECYIRFANVSIKPEKFKYNFCRLFVSHSTHQSDRNTTNNQLTLLVTVNKLI